jgi:hypothetical protein
MEFTKKSEIISSDFEATCFNKQGLLFGISLYSAFVYSLNLVKYDFPHIEFYFKVTTSVRSMMVFVSSSLLTFSAVDMQTANPCISQLHKKVPILKKHVS